MTIVAIVSVSGGVGKTTLAANLASIAGKRGANVLAVEWDPANRLGFHLGVGDSIDDGWASAFVHGQPWQQRAFRNSDAVTFMPFGRLNSSDRTRFEQVLVDEPHWLAQRLQSIDMQPDDLLLLDVERGPSVYMSQALAAADLVLVVMTPSPWFKLEVQTLKDELPEAAGKGLTVRYLLNFADPTRRSAADNTSTMLELLDQELLRYMVHRDESVPDALSANLSIIEFSPDSQASHDLQGLASWLQGLAHTRWVQERS